MTDTAHVLAIDDDAVAREFIQGALSAVGLSVIVVETIPEFWQQLRDRTPDLLIIDVTLADGDGFALAREVRALDDCPIVFLTVHDRVEDRVTGLELGAIDYLAKPVHPRELALRVRNILSGHLAPPGVAADGDPPGDRLDGAGAANRARRFAGWTLDLQKRRLADPHGRAIALTASEFDLLALLTSRPSTVLDRTAILDALGRNVSTDNVRLVDVLVSRVRRKLGEARGDRQFIATLPGRGYQFIEDVTSPIPVATGPPAAKPGADLT